MFAGDQAVRGGAVALGFEVVSVGLLGEERGEHVGGSLTEAVAGGKDRARNQVGGPHGLQVARLEFALARQR